MMLRLMRKKTISALLLAILLLCTACQSTPSSSEPVPSTAKKGVLLGISLENYPTINGSTANHPLIARLYAELCSISVEEGETLVNLDLGSTGSIWENFLRGYGPDLLIAYEPPEDVKAEFSSELEQMEIEPLGRDGLVFLANIHNPVESLTVKQLQQIYTGQLTDWSEVGGDPGPIQPFQRNADSGSQTLFLKLLMAGLTPMDPPTELVQMTMGGLIDGVAAFDGSGSSLGFSVYYYANLMYTNPNLKLLSVNGVAPSAESIQNGEYPLTNDFYVAIRADEPADSPARLVRDWLLTDAGRQLLEEENYVWARDGMPQQASGAGNYFFVGSRPMQSASASIEALSGLDADEIVSIELTGLENDSVLITDASRVRQTCSILQSELLTNLENREPTITDGFMNFDTPAGLYSIEIILRSGDSLFLHGYGDYGTITPGGSALWIYDSAKNQTFCYFLIEGAAGSLRSSLNG